MQHENADHLIVIKKEHSQKGGWFVMQGSLVWGFSSLSVGSFVFFGMFDAPTDLFIFVPFERLLVLPGYASFHIFVFTATRE